MTVRPVVARINVRRRFRGAHGPAHRADHPGVLTARRRCHLDRTILLDPVKVGSIAGGGVAVPHLDDVVAIGTRVARELLRHDRTGR